MEVSRSALRHRPSQRRRRGVVDEVLAQRVKKLIERHPTYGYRRVWAMLRREGVVVNHKAILLPSRLGPAI